jgi:hypothetical protein
MGILTKRTNTNGSYDEATQTATTWQYRLTTNAPSKGHYVNYIAPIYPSLSYGYEAGDSAGPYITEFPNLTLFPLFTLTALEVGLGDGATTAFKPPLNFWVKDTEEIFVNGVQLTRNVDYTCDHFNNLDGLEELIPSRHMILIEANIDTAYPSNDYIRQDYFCMPYEANSLPYSRITNNGLGESCANQRCYPLPLEGSGHGNGQRPSDGGDITTPREYMFADNTHPVVFLMPIDELGFDWSIDTILLRGRDGTHNWTVEGSNDGTEWTVILNNLAITTSWRQEDLQNAITYKYWRFTCNDISGTNAGLYIYMRRKGAQIKFTNPPAANASITMNAKIDRPYHDGNHVFDVQWVYQL